MAEAEFLTPEEVATRLRLNERTVRRLLSEGKLPGIRVGKAWRVSIHALRAHFERTSKPAQDRA